MRRGVRALRNPNASALFEEADDFIQDLLLRLRDLAISGERCVEDRPIQPGEHLVTADGGPRRASEPARGIGVARESSGVGRLTYQVRK